MGANWWVADAWQQGPVVLVSWVVWVIGSIVLHELAHGWTAIRLGDRTPIETGHMTWNPLVHMGQMSLLMFALVGIAWGAMPVDRYRLRGRYGDAIVSFAGPAMNLLLFGIALMAAAVVAMNLRRLGDPLGDNLFQFFITGAYLNLALMIFNLLPVPPLDGSRILADLYPPFARLWSGQNAAVVSMIAFVAVFFFAGRVVFGFADQLTANAIVALVRLLRGSAGA
jgi:Zn-dependent protease